MAYLKSKELLLRGKTKEALDALKPVVENTPLYDEWAMLRARYHRMREQEMKGVQSSQELQLEHNRINDALLRLISSAQSKRSSAIAPVPSAGANGRRAWIGWGLAGVALVVALWFLLPTLRDADANTATSETTEQSLQPYLPPDSTAQADTAGHAAGSEEGLDGAYDRYRISKVTKHRDLPFTIDELGVGKHKVYLKMKLKNGTKRPISLGKLELLYVEGKQEAASDKLKGRQLAAGTEKNFTIPFKMVIPVEPRAFRLRILYRPKGALATRDIKVGFGVYQKIN